MLSWVADNYASSKASRVRVMQWSRAKRRRVTWCQPKTSGDEPLRREARTLVKDLTATSIVTWSEPKVLGLQKAGSSIGTALLAATSAMGCGAHVSQGRSSIYARTHTEQASQLDHPPAWTSCPNSPEFWLARRQANKKFHWISLERVPTTRKQQEAIMPLRENKQKTIMSI